MGAQVGGNFTVTGVAVLPTDVVTVVFSSLGGLVLPDNVIFTLSVTNIVGALDLGVTLFHPVTVGSSSNTFLITHDGSSFSSSSTGLDLDNVYFLLNAGAVAIPEPSTYALACLGLAAFAMWRKRNSRRA